MTYDNFTIKAQDCILKSQQIAAANSQQNVDTAHLLRGIIETDEHVATFLFEKCGIDMSVLQRQLETLIQLTPKVSGSEKQFLSLGIDVSFLLVGGAAAVLSGLVVSVLLRGRKKVELHGVPPREPK